jgi:hypothetical protein
MIHCHILVRKDMDVNQHERLSNITLIRHKLKQRKCLYCCYAFHSHNRV